MYDRYQNIAYNYRQERMIVFFAPCFSAFQISCEHHEQRYTAHKYRSEHYCYKTPFTDSFTIIKTVSQIKMKPEQQAHCQYTYAVSTEFSFFVHIDTSILFNIIPSEEKLQAVITLFFVIDISALMEYTVPVISEVKKQSFKKKQKFYL